MLTVACVLRSGGEYQAEHVRRLRAGVRRWMGGEFRFVCLTDTPIEDVNSVLLRHNWPGWWSKIELFRPGVLSGPVLYLDLDTVVVGPLDDLAVGHRFTVLRNFWTEPGSERIGSGVMAWNADLSSIYERFAADPAGAMARRQTADDLGDQGFIQRNAPVRPERWQDRAPGRVVSWRRHCAERGIPDGASIVCFGGKIRPWHIATLWAEDEA